MTTLITGANGTVSSALLQAMADDAPDLRILLRDPATARELPAVEVAVGDLDEPSSLEAAFSGVEAVWLLTPMGPQAPHQNMNAIWAARHAGVAHIVRMSAVGAGHDAPTRNGRLHALSDAELMASDLGWTIVRPQFFMQNVLGLVSGGRLYGATGEGHLGMIDARDIAELAAHLLREPAAHAEKIYTPTGPASISLREAAAEVEAVIGAPVEFVQISTSEAEAAMLGSGMNAWNAAVNAEYADAYARGWGDFTTDDFPEVVGHPARSFAEFARDHREALSAQAPAPA